MAVVAIIEVAMEVAIGAAINRDIMGPIILTIAREILIHHLQVPQGITVMPKDLIQN